MNFKIKIYWIILLFILVTIIITYPLITVFSNSIYSNGGDSYATIYSIWKIKFEHYSLFFPHSAIYELVTKTLRYFFSDIIIYNLMTCIASLLTGLAGFLLCNKIIKNMHVGIFCGLAMMLSPFRISQSLSHLNFADISGLLFFIYFLICTRENFSFKNILLSGLFFVLTTLWNYQYGFFAGIILVLFLIILFINKLFKHELKLNYSKNKYILITSIICIIILVFFNQNLIKDLVSIQNNNQTVSSVSIRSPNELVTYSAKWFYYLYPSPDNPIFGKLTKTKYDQAVQDLGTNRTEQTLYLGWMPILLMAYGLWRTIKLKTEDGKRKTNVWFFVLLGLVGLALSFSDTWDIFGLHIKPPAQYIFDYLPFFRVYARFGLLVAIPVTILSGIGLSIILERINKSILKPLLLVTCCLLLIIEFLNFPPTHVIGVDYNHMPEVYKQVGKISGDIKIVNYPLLPEETPQGYDYLLWLRIYQKDLFNQDFYKFSADDQKKVLDPNSNDSLNILKKYNVNYIIIRGDKYLNGDLKYYPVNYNNGKIPDLSTNPNFQLINKFGNDRLYKINN